jgi:hypothetical protein
MPLFKGVTTSELLEILVSERSSQDGLLKSVRNWLTFGDWSPNGLVSARRLVIIADHPKTESKSILLGIAFLNLYTKKLAPLASGSVITLV